MGAGRREQLRVAAELGVPTGQPNTVSLPSNYHPGPTVGAETSPPRVNISTGEILEGETVEDADAKLDAAYEADTDGRSALARAQAAQEGT